MNSSVYVSSVDLEELSKGIKTLPKNSFRIILGNDDDSFLGCVIFNFSCKKTGEVQINVYMKSMVDTETNDTASFIIQTDLASLDNFTNKFSNIILEDIGGTIELIDSFLNCPLSI